jgi:1-acyl-sn-glycerol-3-phosphate acyltransferase
MFVSGLIPHVSKDVDFDVSKPYVIVANHFSYLDIVTTNVMLPLYFSFMAKKELADIPIFAIFFKTIDIPVDRSRNRASYQAFEKAQSKLDKGISVMVFPEGGIGTTVPKMRRFKSGAFRLAIENKVPVLPVTIADNWKRLYSGGLEDGGTPGKMRIHIHRPLSTSHLKVEDVNNLKSEVYRIIENQWVQMNPETELES